MIFQDPTGALNPRHTVYEAVAEGIRIHGRRQRGRPGGGRLSRAGLRPAERFIGRYPHEISGGQRQRVLIAGAIALDPQLLLADEPVASLDASIRGEILALLRASSTTGLSIVAVTHDLGLAWNIADRIAVMYLGGSSSSATPKQVLADPQHPYTKALLSVVPETARVEQQILTGETPDPSRIPSGCRFHPRCPLVASGEAERLGVLDRCTGVDVELVDRGGGHWRPATPCRGAQRGRDSALEPPIRGLRTGGRAATSSHRHPHSVSSLRQTGGSRAAARDAIRWPDVGSRDDLVQSALERWPSAMTVDRSTPRTSARRSAPTASPRWARRLGPSISNDGRALAPRRSAGSTVDTPSSAAVVVGDPRAVHPVVRPAVAGDHLGAPAEHVVLDAPRDALGLVGRRPAARHELVGGHGQIVDHREPQRRRSRRRPRA